jgi:hypothetical protein
MSSSEYFTELDLTESFNQFKISSEMSNYLTFMTSFGKVSMKVLPYGVEFATDKVQEILTTEFFEFLETWMLIYVDNILIHTVTRAAHLKAIKTVFQKCKDINLHIRKEKCSFLKQSIKTMGYVVEHNVIKPDPSKIDMLQKARPPATVQELQSFLGLVQFYRNMLPHLAYVAYPLYAATSENFEFQWTSKLHQAFLKVKSMISNEILQTNLVGEEDISVLVDASKHAVCVVLLQKENIVFCASKVLNTSQQKWATIERELFAASWGCKKLRCFIYGLSFKLYTDHKPLVGLVNKQGEVPNTRIQQMLLVLAEYTFQICYLPGVRNIIADYGTRQIDVSEWDKPSSDDPEGLHELLSFEEQQRSEEFHRFLASDNITNEDDEIMTKMKLSRKFDPEGKFAVVLHDNKEKIWVPQLSKRAFFWYLHSQLHIGSTKMLQCLREHNLLWSNAAVEFQELLSQCLCAVKKDSVPKAYTEVKHIQARYTLHILAIDLYSYDDGTYFTTMCIFSKYCWVTKVEDASAEASLKAYQIFCAAHQEPSLISCDNGKEFSLITTPRINNPSYHPQSNGILERFHRELGNHCRIHRQTPDQVYQILNTSESKVLMQQCLQNSLSNAVVCALQCATRTFDYNDLVWRFVSRRARSKHEDTFTGPHRVIQPAGKFSYFITSHVKNSRLMQVNVNDIKRFQSPCTKGWSLTDKYLEDAANELQVKIVNRNVLINFAGMDAIVQDLIDGKLTKLQFFVVPDWPCMPWYQRLHKDVQAEAIRLPQHQDVFVDIKNRQLGVFAWDMWLFALEKMV